MYLLALVTRTNNGGYAYAETVSSSPDKLMTHAEKLSADSFGVMIVWRRTQYVDGENPSWESHPFAHYGTEMFYRIRKIESV